MGETNNLNLTSSIYQTSRFNFEQAAGRLGLSDGIFDKLAEPKEKIEITETPTLCDHHIANIKTFIVRHSDALGPAKGGIRMAAGVTCDDIAGLAMEMSWKTSLIGVPFGGGKSGICCDPSKLSPDDKEIIIRSFTRAARRHFGPEIYIPAPDMGTNETDMGHIRDCIAYSEGTSITAGCYITGKPVILGGIVGRREATGKGVVYTVLSACKNLGLDVSMLKVAVQGFGNVGSVAARAISDAGAKVIAVSDIKGGVINEQGLDVERLAEHCRASGSVVDFDTGQAITNEQLLELDCDVLIPAASQSQIVRDNANNIKARIVAEGANSPTSPEADDILAEKGVFVIPDILCNAGGVFVSYLEYTQETQREQMGLEQVDRRLRQRMGQKFDQVLTYSAEKKRTMRQAAMDIGVSRVVEAIIARGLLP